MRSPPRRYVLLLPNWETLDEAPRYALPPPEAPPEDATAEAARLQEVWQAYYGKAEPPAPSPGGSTQP